MRIVERTESREPCVEAGWKAYDYHLDGRIDREFVLSLRPLGSLLFMENLKKPFFKIEADHYIIKGVVGSEFFRVAQQDDSIDEVLRERIQIKNYAMREVAHALQNKQV